MKLDSFYKKLARFLPLGIEARTTFHQLCTAYAIAAGFTLTAPLSILGQYNNLFYREGDKKILYEGMILIGLCSSALSSSAVSPWPSYFTCTTGRTA